MPDVNIAAVNAEATNCYNVTPFITMTAKSTSKQLLAAVATFSGQS